MITIETTPGEHIKQTAIRLRSAAPARAIFNGIEIRATGTETEADIIAAWETEREARVAAWEASPEGQASKARDAQERWDAQFAVNALLAALPTIDWTDHAAPIGWLCAAQPHMDRVGVTFDRSAVLACFKEHGYEVSAFCGEAFDGKSRDIFARWLIGQALDGIEQVGAPHGIVERFAADWRARFSKARGGENL